MDGESLSPSRLAKTVLLIACCLAAPYAISQSIRGQPIETEAQRLEAVRTLIREEKSRRLVGDPDGKPKSTAAFCTAMLGDLLSKRGFKAIEPVAVLNFEYPVWDRDLPKIERDGREQIAARTLGPYLTKSLQRCADVQEGSETRFSGFSEIVGVPPYRTYVLPKSLNPFPKSKFMYWSEYSEKLGSGRKGYSWVNLDSCEHTSGTAVYTDSLRLRNDPKGQMSALTVYHGKLVAWDMARNFVFGAEQIEPKYESPMKSLTLCRWATYPEEINKK